MIFNFQNNFNSFFAVFGTQSGTIAPSDIGFIPVIHDGRAGFRLATNFVDETAPGGFHQIGFGYTPKAAAGFEIRRQAISVDGAATSALSGQASVETFDTQVYPIAGFAASEDLLITADGVLSTNQPSNEAFLRVPAFSATPSSIFGLFLSSFANGPAGARMASARFYIRMARLCLYPPSAALKYSNLELTGTLATFVSNITNSGRTVGSYEDFFGAVHGFVAERNGGFATIDVPGASRPLRGVERTWRHSGSMGRLCRADAWLCRKERQYLKRSTFPGQSSARRSPSMTKDRSRVFMNPLISFSRVSAGQGRIYDHRARAGESRIQAD